MISIIPNRSVFKISGSDSTKFLQNLLTNDISSLEKTKAIYSMMLSPQGRFLFDIFVINTQGGYLLDIFSDTRDLLYKKLILYKINMNVHIEHLSDMKVAYSYDMPDGIDIFYKDIRYDKLGYRIIIESSSSNFKEKENCYLEDKYKYTIPDGGIDLIYDKAIPPEYGAEELHAISYTKGCYIGQEFISRIKSQGVIRKKIYQVKTDFDLSKILHSTPIMSNGEKIGIFCSGSTNGLGIALIRENNMPIDENIQYTLENKVVCIKLACWYN